MSGCLAAVCAGKKDQTDFIIQKATELGAAKIMPVITARTIADKVKKERFIAQSTEAAEQCRRVDLPVIADAEPLDKVLKTGTRSGFSILWTKPDSRLARRRFFGLRTKSGAADWPGRRLQRSRAEHFADFAFCPRRRAGQTDFKSGNGSGRGFGRLAVCRRRLAGGIKCAFW